MPTKNIILLIVSTILALLLAEIITRKTTSFPINTSTYNKVYDKTLLYRMDTQVEGIDKNGFRNKSVLENADIVAIGDSHTYGFNASSENSWPKLLGKKLNKSVYSFSVGGYGFIQYFALKERAISLKPRYIIIGIYLPNDLEDIANAINFSPYWQTQLKEKNINIADITDSTQLNIVANSLTVTLEKIFFSSAIVSMIKHTMQTKLSQFGIIKKSKNDLILKTNTQDTIFTDIKIKTLISYSDLKIAHVNNSLEIAKVLIKNMTTAIKNAEITPLFVFIPSKENAFYEYLQEYNYKIPANFERLVQSERKITDILCTFLKNENTDFLKIKDYIDKNKSIEKTKQLYPKYDDEHVLAAGYKIYAEAIYDYLEKLEQ